MTVLDSLEPRRVFHFFEEISRIPHGSGHTKAISDWLVEFGRKRGLEVRQDALNNVVLVGPASPGYEQAEPVIFQGHMDMVCEKAPDCPKDMEKEGLDLEVSGDEITARGTTLGADDGIAVAMGLALLDDPSIPRPRLEAVFTVDEEIGMLGAVDLDASGLAGRRMINMDSEEEGVFTAGCAGGVDVNCALPVRREAFAGTCLELKISGLTGGHSGAEIHKGRANGDRLMGRLLLHLDREVLYRLVEVEGGTKDNAIPREARAAVLTPEPEKLRQAVAAFDRILRQEFQVTDPDLQVTAEPARAERLPMDRESTEKVQCLLTSLPGGVQVMSPELEGMVQTSLNLGILYTEDGQVCAGLLVRSSVESQKEMVAEQIEGLLRQLGGQAIRSGDYPGWAYRADSPLRDLFVQVYREQYGKEPKVEAIHAGVECGMFAAKLPGLDCISLGPTLTEIHTYRETMHIASVQRTWNLLLEVLKRIK